MAAQQLPSELASIGASGGVCARLAPCSPDDDKCPTTRGLPTSEESQDNIAAPVTFLFTDIEATPRSGRNTPSQSSGTILVRYVLRFPLQPSRSRGAKTANGLSIRRSTGRWRLMRRLGTIRSSPTTCPAPCANGVPCPFEELSTEDQGLSVRCRAVEMFDRTWFEKRTLANFRDRPEAAVPHFTPLRSL